MLVLMLVLVLLLPLLPPPLLLAAAAALACRFGAEVEYDVTAQGNAASGLKDTHTETNSSTHTCDHTGADPHPLEEVPEHAAGWAAAVEPGKEEVGAGALAHAEHLQPTSSARALRSYTAEYSVDWDGGRG